MAEIYQVLFPGFNPELISPCRWPRYYSSWIVTRLIDTFAYKQRIYSTIFQYVKLLGDPG
jgi:hypothetical protein